MSGGMALKGGKGRDNDRFIRVAEDNVFHLGEVRSFQDLPMLTRNVKDEVNVIAFRSNGEDRTLRRHDHGGWYEKAEWVSNSRIGKGSFVIGKSEVSDSAIEGNCVIVDSNVKNSTIVESYVEGSIIIESSTIRKSMLNAVGVSASSVILDSVIDHCNVEAAVLRRCKIRYSKSTISAVDYDSITIDNQDKGAIFKNEARDRGTFTKSDWNTKAHLN